MDRYYKQWEYYKNHEPIESQINRAQKLIDEYEGNKKYFQIILDLLKDGKCVRVKLKNGDYIDITKIAYESWHWRYVGQEHAKKMNKLKMCLEEYIEYLQKGNT